MNELNAGYWNHRFEAHDTPWDIGYVSAPLKKYFDQIPDKNIAILIPGCGNSYEAAYLLSNGFTNITLVDISTVLTNRLAEKLKQYLGNQLTIVTGDFFELNGKFDLIIEQTFFCALEPVLRKQYITQMYNLLKDGGKIAGLLFNKIFTSPGPPFGGNMHEYRHLFAVLFNIRTMEPCYNSVAPRAGAECFFIVTKATDSDV
jgi:methyl halide transferase